MFNKEIITSILTEFINESPYNKVKELDDMVIYDEPIVGIAAANDPLFTTLKDSNVIGAHHMAPNEWLSNTNSVISYFLPFDMRVRSTNRKNYNEPSNEWLYARIEGEELNNMVRKFLANSIIDMGGMAIVPSHDSRYGTIDRRSNWSERHVAYIAGLGTFGLAKNLITEKGCAGRFGSVITDIEIKPTERSYKEVYEYCNDCGACIRRCPADAITKDGKDHAPCDNFLDAIRTKFAPRYGCGKCQTAVPCETKIPKKLKK